MALWLRKGAGYIYVKTFVGTKSTVTRCHSFAQKDLTEPVERHGSEPVRISTLEEKPCCKFMPLTFPSKASTRPKRRKLRNSTPPNPTSDPDGDTADWISRAVNDPLVEIDPVTMAQHLRARPQPRKSDEHTTNFKTLLHKASPRRISSLLVSTSCQPFTYFSPPPQGFGRVVVVAVGASVLLASLASAVHLFRARRQLEKVAGYDSSSDEESKLDLLSLVDDQQDNINRVKGFEEEQVKVLETEESLAVEEEISLENVAPEVVYAAAVAALAQSGEFQRAFAAQQYEAKTVQLELPVDVQETSQLMFQRPSKEELENQVEEGPEVVQSSAEDTFQRPSKEKLANQVEEEAQLVQRFIDTFQRLFLRLSKEKLANQVEEVQSLTEEQSYSLQPELTDDGIEETSLELTTDDLTAPFMDQPPAETSEDLKRQREFLRNLELLCLTTFVFVFLGVPGTEQDAMAGDVLAMSERDNELKRVVQAAVPAVALGAGAMSMLTGVDGALEMVGLAATASFIYYDLLFADSRKNLGREFRNITDHRKLTEFLKSKKIAQPDL